MNNQLIAYYIENMASKEFIEDLFNQYGIRYRKSYNYKKCKEVYCNSEVVIDDAEFVEACRRGWQPSPIEYHINNLQSGQLLGHNWHGARPSMLHLSLQDKVRECIDSQGEIDILWNIAKDIMKQEYFMVAAHDVCESLIIRDIDDTLPPTRLKSISDFIFRCVPYDLKVSTYPQNWTKGLCQTEEDRRELAVLLIENADKQRIRKRAQNTYNGWGNNRFYILVSSQERWFNDTDTLLNNIMENIEQLGDPLEIELGEDSLLVQIVEV